jgi:Large polyvalent protein associated domain 23
MPDSQEYTFEPVDPDHDPFEYHFEPVPPGHDPFASNQDAALAGSMTHPDLDPVREDVGRRLRQSGQNLLSTWLAPITAAKRLGEAATYGTLDVTDPQTAGEAFSLASGLTGVGTRFAEPGAAGIFGGKLAKTANLSALKLAKEMENAGVSYRDIWRHTGWAQGADGAWRFEIPDTGAQFRKTPAYGSKSTDTMADVLAHPELYAAYPELANMQAYRMSPRATYTGVYDPPYGGRQQAIGLNTAYPDDPVTVLIHELQHAVQDREGFEPGGMPKMTPEVRKNYSPDEAYPLSMGETEARNVEARRTMKPGQRRAKPPWTTQDIPYDFQLPSR